MQDGSSEEAPGPQIRQGFLHEYELSNATWIASSITWAKCTP